MIKILKRKSKPVSVSRPLTTGSGVQEFETKFKFQIQPIEIIQRSENISKIIWIGFYLSELVICDLFRNSR